ncbi:MAG: class I SAM-dependent methyltransferase [Phycisphaeraceae bacterium]
MNRFQRRCYALVKKHVEAGGRVLEVSCGEGEILVALKADGYGVVATNYTAYELGDAAIERHDGVDLLAGLPFEDGVFDAVVLSDVIEHLSDHPRALSEISRVLRPGGVAVILTPNTNRISSRVHYLFSGFQKVKRSFPGFDVPAEEAFAFHNYPPHLPVFLYQAHSYGLGLREFDAEWYKPKSLLMGVPLYPVIWLTTWYMTRRRERHLRGRDEGVLLLRAMTGFKGLFGETAALVFERAADGGDERRETAMPAWYHGRGEVGVRSS